MQLPFAEMAVVDRRKLTDYLLSDSHPQGRSKARFFLRLGFSLDRPEELAEQLRQLALEAKMTETMTKYGPKYRGSGRILSPTGRAATVTTIWVLRDGMPPPLLVTAYPA